jgi:hypothetical protein
VSTSSKGRGHRVNRNFLTLGDAALHFGVRYHRLYQFAKQDKFPTTKVNRVHLVAVEDLDAVRAVCVEAGILPAREEAAHVTR